MLRDLLRAEGIKIGRLAVATLMRRMGIEALYRRPSGSKHAPGHEIHPYLLRNLVVGRPNQILAMDITYILSCTRFPWTPICPRIDRNDDVQHEEDRSSFSC